MNQYFNSSNIIFNRTIQLEKSKIRIKSTFFITDFIIQYSIFIFTISNIFLSINAPILSQKSPPITEGTDYSRFEEASDWLCWMGGINFGSIESVMPGDWRE